MTMRNGIPIDATGHRTGDQNAQGLRSVTTVAPLAARVWARSLAGRYDRQIEDGVRIKGGTPLAAHYVRVVSRRERQDLARSVALLLRDAGVTPTEGTFTKRVPIRARDIAESADLFVDALARLLGPLPVRARGMARLRILLADGRGPIYCAGSGSLPAALRGVIAAM